jgi:ABC-type Zn uptake system ZnuABC Zn-binding protein ZnuA
MYYQSEVFMKILLSVLFLLLGSPHVQAAEEPIDVVATNSILADWIKNVGREKVEVHALVGPNGDVHTFEPTPKDTIALAKAQAVINIGVGLEPWLKDLYKASGSRAHRYTVAEGLDLIHLVKTEGVFRDEVDPHFWLDPTKVVWVIQKIATALVNEDPANAQYYWDNARTYLAELVKLDEWITKQVRKIPEERRKIVTSHDTFAYFGKRYGFEIVGSIIDSATTEAADPSALKITQLIERIKTTGAPAIFLENVSNPKVTQAVARETGVRLAPALYTDALSEPGTEADTYLKMMTYNVEVFAEALKKR